MTDTDAFRESTNGLIKALTLKLLASVSNDLVLDRLNEIKTLIRSTSKAEMKNVDEESVKLADAIREITSGMSDPALQGYADKLNLLADSIGKIAPVIPAP